MRNGKSYSEAGKLGAIASLKTHNEKKKKRIEEYNDEYRDYFEKFTDDVNKLIEEEGTIND